MNQPRINSRRTVGIGAAALLILAAVSPAHGQQQPQSPQPSSQQPATQTSSPQQSPPAVGKISAQSNLVTVYATVRDKKGQIIKDLKKDDFALDEDGRPQAITYFARENDLPLTVGLLVDTSLSQRRVLEQERSASYTFLDHMLRDNEDKKDRAFVIHFDYEVELLQELTSSRPKLQAALQSLETPRPEMVSQQSGGSSGGGGHGSGGGHHGGGTLLYDAVFLASDEVMRKEQGRKALIVLSDGVDHGSQESLESAIRAAQRANTIVYSILFKDDDAYSQHPGYSGGHGSWGGGGGGYGGHHGGGQRYPQEDRPDGKKILDRISRETGGRLFVVSKKEPVDQIYSEIEQELRNQYVLGYPPEKSESGGYHRIHLITKQKDLIVQARDGYFSEP